MRLCTLLLAASLSVCGCTETLEDIHEFELKLPCANIGAGYGKLYVSLWYQDTCPPGEDKYLGVGHLWE
jgi:hypothetical protein